MKKIINDKLIQALINYLSTKPFNEVYNFIAELSKLETVPERRNFNEEVTENLTK